MTVKLLFRNVQGTVRVPAVIDKMRFLFLDHEPPTFAPVLHRFRARARNALGS